MRRASQECLEAVDLLITCLAVIQLLVSAHLHGDLSEEDLLSDFEDILPDLRNPNLRLLPEPLQHEVFKAVSEMLGLPRESIRLAPWSTFGYEVPARGKEGIRQKLLSLQQDLEQIRAQLTAE